MFVITVAPQYLICHHGKAYPIKAIIVVRIKIVTPILHVSFRIKELFITDSSSYIMDIHHGGEGCWNTHSSAGQSAENQILACLHVQHNSAKLSVCLAC